MQPVVPHRLFDRLALMLVVAALATPLTYLEVARPSENQLRDLAHRMGMGVTEPAVYSQPKPTYTKPTPVPVPTPTATQPAPAMAAAKTATTTSLVHMRSGKSVDSSNVMNLGPGTTVQLRDDADATWQGVRYKDKDGYIYRDYLKY